VRALPYTVIRRALRRLEAAGEPAILYVHPWELDLGQRYNRVTARERVTHYLGRSGLAAKLERLFSEFRFGTMGDLVRQLEAGTVPVAEPAAAPGLLNRQLTV
jgi:hypothetical protein